MNTTTAKYLMIATSFAVSNVSYGQSSDMRCALLKNIVAKIDSEKQKLKLWTFIERRSSKYYDSVNQMYVRKKKALYINDTRFDSVLRTIDPRTFEYYRPDSLFNLSDNFVILDTTGYFTATCNCNIDGTRVSVFNKRNDMNATRYAYVILQPSPHKSLNRDVHRVVDCYVITLARGDMMRKFEGVVFLFFSLSDPRIWKMNVTRPEDF